MILGYSGQIPYAGEQGHYSAHQGIQLPCSSECRDISVVDAPLRRPLGCAAARERFRQIFPWTICWKARFILRTRAEISAMLMPSASFKDELIAEMPNLRAFAISLSSSLSMADDLVQEALLRAWRHSDKFQPGTSLRAWLFTILRNIYFSNYRKRGREVQDSDGIFAKRLTVSGDQESHLDVEDFRRALAQLPAEQREVLILVGANGLSYEKAAEICDVEIGTIKSRLSRARSKLVELLDLDDFRRSRDERRIVAKVG
jgi:RNA polymerase sigma-70 factor, ECF subfamily